MYAKMTTPNNAKTGFHGYYILSVILGLTFHLIDMRSNTKPQPTSFTTSYSHYMNVYTYIYYPHVQTN